MQRKSRTHLLCGQGSIPGQLKVSDESKWYVFAETWEGDRLLNTRILSKHDTEKEMEQAYKAELTKLRAERQTEA